jgi:hypothetical protein
MRNDRALSSNPTGTKMKGRPMDDIPRNIPGMRDLDRQHAIRRPQLKTVEPQKSDFDDGRNVCFPRGQRL